MPASATVVTVRIARIALITTAIGILSYSVPAISSEVPIAKIVGTTGASFSVSMGNAGDMNRDGFEDLIVGAPATLNPPVDEGRAYLYMGGNPLDVTADRTYNRPQISGTNWFDDFGYSVAGVGDVNGDGFPDLLIGSPGTLSPHAKSYLYFGGHDSDERADLVLSDDNDLSAFGLYVAQAGDFNGDGSPDFVVCSIDSVFVYFGGAGLDEAPDFVSPASSVVEGVSAAGDWNADGYDDIFVATNREVLLFLGGTHPNPVPALRIPRPRDGLSFGYTIASGADLDGDGAPDLAVGAPFVESPFENTTSVLPGRVYIFRGGPGFDALPDYVIEDPEHRAWFGTTLACGDVNGDGTADLVVGAPHFFLDVQTAGRVLVFAGGRLGSGPANVLDRGDAAFGGTVTTCDLTGDQYPEVIVGEYRWVTAPDAAEPDVAFVYDLASPLAARAFVASGDSRSLPLNENGRPVCVVLEPLHTSFAVADLDLSSVRLSSGAREIAPVVGKGASIGDEDGNGIADVTLCFERSDLAHLFPDVRGRATVSAVLNGRCVDGRSVEATLSLTVVGVSTGRKVASIQPNPLNPEGTLEFTMERPGTVTVRIYDSAGRRVRVIDEGSTYTAGSHSVRIDGKDQGGRSLASGVYFYEIRTGEDARRGRFAILK